MPLCDYGNVCMEKNVISNQNRHLDQLNALYAITQIISKSFGQRQMLHEVLDVLSENLGMYRTVVMLSSRDGSELVVEAVENNEIQSDTAHIRYRRGEGITGRVLETALDRCDPGGRMRLVGLLVSRQQHQEWAAR